MVAVADSKLPMFDYDKVLQHIGQCGWWQKKQFLLLCLFSMCAGLAVVVYAFVGFVPEYRCQVPYCENKESSMYYYMNGNKSLGFPSYVTQAIPSDALLRSSMCTYKHAIKEVEKCDDYLSKISGTIEVDYGIKQCGMDKLVFDKSIVLNSVATQYGFTCENSFLNAIFSPLYMFGMLFGSFIFGWISDHYGRLKSLMASTACVSLSGILGALITNSYAFGFFRFLTGMGGIGVFMVSFVLVVELVGYKYTMLIGIAIEIPFAIGEMILGLEAYYIRDWYALQLVAYAPMLVLLLLWFIIPESPRWLISKGRTNEARDIILAGTKDMNVSIPEEVFQEEKQLIKKLNKDCDENIHKNATFIDLFRPNIILKRSLNMFYQWFSVTMCYYGLTFASSSLSGDVYSNFMLNVFIEIPADLFCIFVMGCWGRRPILSFCQIVSGLACIGAGLLTGVESLGSLQVLLSLIGKFGATACFAIVYVYTAELFPTSVRNTAIGSCSTIARIGGISALVLNEMFKNMWPPGSMLLMGIVALIAGFLALLFPETVGNKLPTTMEDVIKIQNNSNRGLCTCVCPSKIGDLFIEVSTEDDVSGTDIKFQSNLKNSTE